jgi:hypothetical protein
VSHGVFALMGGFRFVEADEKSEKTVRQDQENTRKSNNLTGQTLRRELVRNTLIGGNLMEDNVIEVKRGYLNRREFKYTSRRD